MMLYQKERGKMKSGSDALKAWENMGFVLTEEVRKILESGGYLNEHGDLFDSSGEEQLGMALRKVAHQTGKRKK